MPERLRGNWHYIAFATLASMLTVMLDQFIFILIYVGWILFIYLKERLSFLVLIYSLLSIIFFYFYIPAPNELEKQIQSIPTERVTLTGNIKQFPLITDQKLEFVFSSNEIEEDVLVVHFFDREANRSQNDLTNFKYGTNCIIHGEIQIPNEATNPYQFDYRSYLVNQGIALQVIVNDVDEMNCEKRTNLFTIIQDLRTHYISYAKQNLHPEIFSWQLALIFGDRNGIDESILLLFQRWGLSHLLAISGLHVGIISAFIYTILVRFSIVTKEQAQSFIIVFLPMYALIAGGQPSVWRASLMGALILLLQKTRYKLRHTDLISLVFLLLIISNKYIIYHIGFQFSFLVTFGLILSFNMLKSAATNVERLLLINFVSQMVIVPIQMIYFYHFQPLSIIINLLVVPYFSVIVIPGMFISTLISTFPPMISTIIQQFFLHVHHFIINILISIDESFHYPFLTGDLSFTFVVIYYMLFIFLMVHLEKGKKVVAFYCGIAISLLLTFQVVKPYFSNEGFVTMLDIGQGDAFIIELPYRKGVFMIDAGAIVPFYEDAPKDRTYKQVIKPYLMGRGIDQIDAIFITHQHTDHDGSVPYILEDFHVSELIVHPYYDVSTEFSSNGNEVTISRASCNEKIVRKKHSFYVISPCVRSQNENENSLVLYTRIGGLHWLFTGDIEEQSENELMERYGQIDVDVLKVAHHGSKTSSQPHFLKQINPTYALIPVGRSNRFGHPAKQTIEQLKEVNTTIFRTDINGAVVYLYKDKNNTGKFKLYRNEIEEVH